MRSEKDTLYARHAEDVIARRSEERRRRRRRRRRSSSSSRDDADGVFVFVVFLRPIGRMRGGRRSPFAFVPRGVVVVVRRYQADRACEHGVVVVVFVVVVVVIRHFCLRSRLLRLCVTDLPADALMVTT